MAKDSTTVRSAKPRPMKRRNKVLLIVSGLLAMGFFRTGFVFILIGVLPSIIAYYIDFGRHRYLFHSVFACNLTGLMPFIGKMVAHGPHSALLQHMMGDLMNWVLIYGAALVGFFLVRIMPIFAQTMIEGFHHAQIERLTNNQKRIENEWGVEAGQFSRSEDEDDAYV